MAGSRAADSITDKKIKDQKDGWMFASKFPSHVWMMDSFAVKDGQFRERVAASLFAGLNAYLKKNRAPEPKAK